MVVCESRAEEDAASLLDACCAIPCYEFPGGLSRLLAALSTPENPGLTSPRNREHEKANAAEGPALANYHQPAPAARPRTIRVLLVDDHAAVRQAFAFALRSELDIEVVGEAGSAPVALEEIRRLRPDLVLMDINLPGMDGIEATRRIRAEFPHIEVIGLSMYESEEQDAAMRRAGARAYVSKSASYETLLEAIRGSRETDPS